MNHTAILLWLTDAASEPLDRYSVETLAHTLNDAKSVLDAARNYVAAVEQALVKKLPARGVVEVAGLGTLERKSGAKRTKWDTARVAPLVARIAVEAREPDANGEIPDPVDTAVSAVLNAAGIGYWKVSVLRELGLAPEGFCSTDWGVPRVVLNVNAEADAA